MSGFRAPALTATPSSASWKGVTVLPTILPLLTSSAIGPGFWLTRSTVPLANLCPNASPSARMTVTLCTLERGAELFQAGHRPLVGDDDEVGRKGRSRWHRSQRRQYARCGEFRVPSH